MATKKTQPASGTFSDLTAIYADKSNTFTAHVAEDAEAAKKLKHAQKVIKKMTLSLLETGLFSEGAIKVLNKAEISDKIIIESIAQQRRDLYPEPLKHQSRYVLGVVFNPEITKILLVWKNRPDWQKGLLNAVGGKIEGGETPHAAMIREFREETGIVTGEVDTDHEANWLYVGRRHRDPVSVDLEDRSYEMFIFVTVLPYEHMLSAEDHPSDEPPICMPLNREILARRGVPGLAWVVDAAAGSLLEGFHIDVEDPQ